VILIVGLDLGQKAFIRDLLGSLAEVFLVSFWKGIEMSFYRQLQSAVSHCGVCDDSGCVNRRLCGG
jgi:hypothetical protein